MGRIIAIFIIAFLCLVSMTAAQAPRGCTCPTRTTFDYGAQAGSFNCPPNGGVCTDICITGNIGRCLQCCDFCCVRGGD